MVSPGVRFLLQTVLPVLARPLLFGIALHHGSRFLDYALPLWATAVVASASLPTLGALSIWRKQRQHAREAAALGARLAPQPQGRWLGNLDLLRRLMWNSRYGYPTETITNWMAELGPVVNVRMFWTDAIVTSDPEHIKRVLSTDFSNYEKGPRFQNIMRSVLGTGVFNSDGDMWKFHRTITRPFFAKDRISHFEELDRNAELVITTLKSRSRGGYAVDFQDLIARFTMDSATEMLFGTCVNSLKAPVPYAHNANVFGSERPPTSDENAFIEAFSQAMEQVARREQRGLLAPLAEMWEDTTAKSMKVVSAFLDPIIAAAVERKKVADAMGGEKREAQTLLDELLNSTSDHTILKDETLNILLAGRDTTMHTLTMVMYFLCIHPAVNERLRAEVLDHVGPSRQPTYEDIKDMKYLRAVINEALRLYPPVPFNVRSSVNATTWPSPDPNEKPIYIPAGTSIPYSVLIMQRRKDLWGPDADDFDPDRFLDARVKKYLLSNAFQFLPFNAGPRICLGQQFAYNEMSFMLIRLLQSFSGFTLDEEACPPAARVPPEWKGAPGRKGIERFRPKMHLTMSTQGGLWIRVAEATD